MLQSIVCMVSAEPQTSLGEALRQVRRELGLKQEAVGLKADIHPTWISHIESGRENPTWSTVTKIAAALGIKVSELAQRVEELDEA
jgi:transcriptional regulator with XRE-family HTH domain